jgi:hypothetical protein
MVEISDVVRSIVLHADIYEEEDFSVKMYGLQFFPDADGPRDCQKRWRMHFSTAARNRCQTSEQFDRCIDFTLHRGVPIGISQNMRVVGKVVRNTSVASDKGGTTLGTVRQRNFDEIVDGTKSATEPKDDTHLSVLSKCFDPYVYRPLVGSAPVRKVAFHTPEESIPVLSKVLSEIGWAVCDLILSASTMVQIRRMLNHVSISSVNILSRSLIVLNLYFDDKLLGQYSLGFLIGNEMTQMMGFPMISSEANYGKTSSIDSQNPCTIR